MLKTDISLILLAGGEGSRMKQLTSGIPKSLLPVYDESLLQRHIRQAKEAGIKRVLVSTRPEWINIFLDHLSNIKLNKNIKIFPNSEHKYGSLPALLTAATETGTSYLLMSFVDIFSFENPYIIFTDDLNSKCVLGVSQHFDLLELARGGIVFTKNKHVQLIKELPLKNTRNGYRWNGLCLFSYDLIKDLRFFLKNYPKNSPEGDFFEFWRSKENIITYKICSDFLNVNTPQDLLVASLYNYSFCTNNKNAIKIAAKLRKRFFSSK